MKNIIAFIKKMSFVTVVAMCGNNIAAQNTNIPDFVPLQTDSNYMYPQDWIYFWHSESNSRYYSNLGRGSGYSTYPFIPIIPKEPATIYGVAFGAYVYTHGHSLEGTDYPALFADTTVRTYIFKSNGDTTAPYPWSNDSNTRWLDVEILSTGTFNPAQPDYLLPPKELYSRFYDLVDSSARPPIYESYFSTPVTIDTDTLYIAPLPDVNIAISNRLSRYNLFYYCDEIDILDTPYTAYNVIEYNDSTLYARILTHPVYYYKDKPIIFPILSPGPSQHSDTVNIVISAGLLERYINVYPTVADGGAVTVLSSFHLEGVEVYDAAGRMLCRQPASGVAMTVDVSQLPAGSYMLRINTVSGSTTKKFLKR